MTGLIKALEVMILVSVGCISLMAFCLALNVSRAVRRHRAQINRWGRL